MLRDIVVSKLAIRPLNNSKDKIITVLILWAELMVINTKIK